MKHDRIKKLAAVVTALTMAFTSLPAAEALAAGDSVDTPSGYCSSWSGDISAMTKGTPGKDYVEGEVIACVKTTGSSILKRQLGAFESEGYESETLMELSGDEPAETGAGRTKLLGSQGGSENIVIIRDHDKSTEEILRELSNDPSVTYAEPNYIAEMKNEAENEAENDAENDAENEAENEAENDAENEVSADDIEQVLNQQKAANADTEETGGSVADGSSMQYAYTNEGAHFKDLTSGMNVPGWNSKSGNMKNQQIVAVIDTGIDWTHPDLKDNIYTFTAQQQSKLGCGTYGYDAVPEEKPDAMDNESFAQSINLHGTHCAGSIASKWDGQGTSGIGSDIKIVNVRLLNDDGCVSMDGLVKAFSFIKKAYLMGIDIKATSNSWIMFSGNKLLDTVIRDVGDTTGILSLYAAGNERQLFEDDVTNAYLLSDNPYVIRVAASDLRAKKPNFTNFSASEVDVAAPGYRILSTVPAKSSSYIPGLSENDLLYSNADGSQSQTLYMYKEGQSAQKTKPKMSDEYSMEGKKSYKFEYNKPLQQEETVIIESEPVKLDPEAVSDGKCFLGFHFRTDAVNTVQCDLKIKNTEGEWKDLSFFGVGGEDWAGIRNRIPAEADHENFTYRLEITTLKQMDQLELFLDSIGVGREKVRYQYLSGTSMATPAVAGAVAILASKNTYSKDPAERARQLKADLLGSTREESDFASFVKTGGIVDLGIPAKDYCPSIGSIEKNGKNLTISGYHFGNKKGKVSAVLTTGGNKSAEYSTADGSLKIKSWASGKVVVNTGKELSGRIDLTVENVSGRHFTFREKLGESSDVFEHEYALPAERDDPYVQEVLADQETIGTMLGIDNNLYFLQMSINAEEMPYLRYIWEYNIADKTWEKTEVKEPLENVSAVVYDGKILLEGGSMSTSSAGIPVSTKSSREIVYLYDPANGSWKKQSSSGVATSATFANVDGNIFLVANEDTEGNAKLVCEYTPGRGAGKTVGALTIDADNCLATTYGDEIYVFRDNKFPDEDSEMTRFSMVFQKVNVETGQCKDISSRLPDYRRNGKTIFYKYYSLCSVESGPVLCGPAMGVGCTTWCYDVDKDEFEPCEKQISDGNIRSCTLAGYRGQLYGIASDTYEDGKMVFRSTEMGSYAQKIETRSTEVMREKSGKEKVDLVFYDQDPNVAYIDINDYYRLLFPEKEMTVKALSSDPHSFILKSHTGQAVANTANETITSNDLEAFANTAACYGEGIDNIYYDGQPYVKYDRTEKDPKTAPSTLDLDKYNIDIRTDGNKVYFPVATLADIYSSLNYVFAFYSGEKVYVENMNYVDQASKRDKADFIAAVNQNLQDRPKESDLVDFTYNELCFALDHFHCNVRERSELYSLFAKEKNLDKALDAYTKDGKNYGKQLKGWLRSADQVEYTLGMYLLNGLLCDGDHTSLEYGLTYKNTAEQAELTEGWDKVLGDDSEAWHKILESIYGPEGLYFDKYSSLSKLQTNKYGDETYIKEGDTAVCVLKSFLPKAAGATNRYIKDTANPNSKLAKNDPIVIVAEALKQAKADGVKNFVIDISTNLGGSVDIVMGVMSYVLNTDEVNSNYMDVQSGQHKKVYYKIDKNFDGKFDEEDKKIDYSDMNFAILTSEVSFSCGNIFPAWLKDRGIAILGEQSGGGACAVQQMRGADGLEHQISSAKMYALFENGEGIDNGVPVDVSLVKKNADGTNDYSDFFNLSRLSEEVTNYYKPSVEKAKVTLNSTAFTYTGKKPAVAVKSVVLDGNTLTKGTDYTVTIPGAKAVGTYRITIKGIGAYKGAVVKTFRINPAKITSGNVSVAKSTPYTGKATKPAVKVIQNGATLKAGRDYTVTYKNNTNVTTKAKAVIKGKGNYTGTITKTYAVKLTKGTKAVVSKITYMTTGSAEVAVTGTTKTKGTLSIPKAVKIGGQTLKVTQIYAKAFKGNKGLTKITVGDNVTTIGSEAFRDAKKLKTLSINGNQLKTIGKNAFKNLTKKTTIIIRAKTKSIYKKVKKQAQKAGAKTKYTRKK